MSNFSHKIRKISFLFSDIILLYLSLLNTLFIRYQGKFNQDIWQSHWPIFTGLFLFWIIIFYSFNLYELSIRKNFFNLFNNFLPAIILNVLIGIIYFYILSPKTNITPKTILAILVIIFTLSFFVSRRLVSKINFSDKFLPNLLFIGYNPLIQQLLPGNNSNQRFEYCFKGLITTDGNNISEINIPTFNINKIEEIIKKEKINLVVINETNNQEITDALFKILPMRINFISLTNFYEQVKQKIPIDIINRGWFLDNFSEGNRGFYEVIKRFFDFIFSIICIIILIIFVPIIIFVIKISSKGKVVFKQIRVGKDGKKFTALKFRSMYENAEKSGPTWAKENDPRITKVGKFLRKTRLDEIPQLINILKGDMSFIGPRPERPEFITQLKTEIPFYRERLLVKPGLSGWAQIKFPYADSVDSSLKKLQYDLFYIKHRSMFLDMSIILKTISIILKGGGR